MSAVTPAERIRYLRHEHVRIEYPVAHCRKDRQNWPCDVIKGLDAAAAVERERIRALAIKVGAHTYSGPVLGVDERVEFADLISDGGEVQ